MRFLKTKTIRNKILLVFSAAFLVLLLSLFLVNRLFLVDHFIRTNERNMRREAKRFIQEVRTGDKDAASAALIKNTGANLYLFTEDLEPLGYLSFQQNNTLARIVDLETIYGQAKASAGYFTVLGDGEPEDKALVFADVMGNGSLLVLTKAMGVVEEASALFFRFMLLSSAFVYLAGFVIIFFISRNLSRPVIEMKRITHKMANLEFDEKLTVKGSDEIGELTASVNRMAGNLSEAIEALHASNEKLERELSKERSLEKMRRRFVSDVSHELKNPISVLLGYADGLIQNVPKTEDARREYYGIIFDEANGMNMLVKNLLDLSSYEAGTFTLDMETFDLAELIESTLKRLRYLAGGKTIEIVFQPEARYELTADPLRIRQVVNNLLGNAFQYVDDGGTIKIDVSQTGETTKIIIANTGPPIPQKDLELIWNSFYQVQTGHGGSGLGLAIVKSIVELHKGTCRAYVKDRFNCFEVVL